MGLGKMFTAAIHINIPKFKVDLGCFPCILRKEEKFWFKKCNITFNKEHLHFFVQQAVDSCNFD